MQALVKSGHQFFFSLDAVMLIHCSVRDAHPPLHALCEEEWLQKVKVCMFCRLPVKRVEAGGQAKDTVWVYRTK